MNIVIDHIVQMCACYLSKSNGQINLTWSEQQRKISQYYSKKCANYLLSTQAWWLLVVWILILIYVVTC